MASAIELLTAVFALVQQLLGMDQRYMGLDDAPIAKLLGAIIADELLQRFGSTVASVFEQADSIGELFGAVVADICLVLSVHVQS